MARVKHGGRKAGTPNKLTKTVKDEFEHVFNELQKDPKANLLSWGKENATEFYKLAKALIPTDVNAKLSGAVKVNGTIKFV